MLYIPRSNPPYIYNGVRYRKVTEKIAKILSAAHITGMMRQYFLTQARSVHVQVYFRGAYRIVSQHLLNSAQVGTAIKQVGCKRMPQRMRRNRLVYSGSSTKVLYYLEHAHTRHSASATVKEHY